MLACPECRKLYPSDASGCADDGHALVPLEDLPEEDTPLEPGTMVGEYRIDRKLGSGTFGAVYAAEQPLIGKRVAIKVLHRKFASDTGVVSRFVSEARAVNRIRHPNIIDIFSFGVGEGNVPYFVMELVEGMTLRDLIDREKRIGLGRAIPILRGIAEGLDAAHEAGVTHRDLKPDNIFLAREKGGGDFPKLLDFGIAKLVSDDAAHKTATGAAIGTPSYMAPEQCRGQRVDHLADVYALGVVIHEMLTGRRLFEGDSSVDLLLKHVSEPPRPMSEVCPDLPKELDAPVLAMLAKKPRARPQSAGAAVAALAARAQATMGAGDPGKAPAATAAPSSFERALERREAATVMTRGAVAVAATPSEEAPGLGSATVTPVPASGPAADGVPAPGDASHPEGRTLGRGSASTPPAPEAPAPPLPMVPATTADGRFAISSKGNAIKVWDLRTGQAVHTFPGAPGPPVPASPAARKPASVASATPARRGARTRSWAIFVAGAAVLAAATFLLKARTPAPLLATAEPASEGRPLGRVTLRLAVTPADADVIADGVRAGKASEPLVLPRSDRPCLLRFEKSGFEARTLWTLPDRDRELPPVTLRAAAGAAEPPPDPAQGRRPR